MKTLQVALLSFLFASSLSTATDQVRREDLFDFTLDFLSGGKDTHGQMLAGTEIMALETHGGMIFAGAGLWRWKEQPGDPAGAQIFVKKSANAAWEADMTFPSSYGRIACLHEVAFTTDAHGKALPQPVSVLLGGVAKSQAHGVSYVVARDDRAGASPRWIEMAVSRDLARYTEGAAFSETRAIYDHRDRITGVHHVFATLSAGSSNDGGYIVRGAYDPDAPGLVRWETIPDCTGPKGQGFARRGLSGTATSEAVYMTINVERTRPQEGGLWRRTDGADVPPEQRWKLVYEWPLPRGREDTRRSGMRGITAMPAINGADEFLLAARELPGVIERIETAANHRVTLELDVRAALTRQWRGLSGLIINYDNNMTPWKHPDSGEQRLLIPLGAGHPDRPSMNYVGPSSVDGDSAWYLVRKPDASYTLGRITDPKRPHPIENFGLRSARTACVSPFPEDAGRVVFIGGYDAGSSAKHRYRNTAWIMRGQLNPQTQPTTKP
jgi:hypothetical protein